MNSVKQVLFILAAILCIQCNQPQKELENLKQKYTIEELNYFYEVAFLEESSLSTHPLIKRAKDVKICLVGAQEDDSITVSSLIVELNNMQLPIAFSVIDNSIVANMIVHFGDRNYLDNIFPGIFISDDTNKIRFGHGSIDKKEALIGIINTIDDNDKLRGTQEEIIQSLGLTCDSWHYPNSLFFQGISFSKSFTPMDKRLLQLLYEDYFTTRYTITDFERDFAEELYHVNSAQKIADHIRENNIPIRYLDSIKTMAPNRGTFKGIYYKYPHEIAVSPVGSYSEADSAFLVKTLALFNQALGEKQKLYLAKNATFLPRIDIAYLIDNLQEDDVMLFSEGHQLGKLAATYYIYSNMTITSKPNAPQEKINEVLLTGLYWNLGLDCTLKTDFYSIDEDGDEILKSEYFEILSLFSEPVFYSGITVSEIDKAIEILKQSEK